jgi:hypothetical protein
MRRADDALLHHVLGLDREPACRARSVPGTCSRRPGRGSPTRPVLPKYAPSSCRVGSRAAWAASRGLGCPRRAQERRGRTREAPGSAGADSIRPVVRTLRVGRRNRRPRRSPVGSRRSPVGLSSQSRSWSDGARSSPSSRPGTRTRRTRVVGEPGSDQALAHPHAGGRRKPSGRRHSARNASWAASAAKPVTRRQSQSRAPLPLDRRSREARARRRYSCRASSPARDAVTG